MTPVNNLFQLPLLPINTHTKGSPLHKPSATDGAKPTCVSFRQMGLCGYSAPTLLQACNLLILLCMKLAISIDRSTYSCLCC